jgi:uncharacterized membrane protein YdcZ (DUF606 family)
LSHTLLIGLLIAVGSGIAIGLQTLITTVSGQSLGAAQNGFFLHLTGALIGALIVGLLALHSRASLPHLRGSQAALVAAGGALGMIILIGVATAFPRTGQLAGQAAIIFGQMVVALAVDTSGLAGQAIPLDWRRLLGLALLTLSAYLLLPRR